MRARSFAIGCALATAAGAISFVNCVDIFHSTDFDVPSKGPVDFCSWTESEAQSHATKACALLAACQSPVGENAPGECIVNATFAYDCSASPNLPIAGDARAFWACMAQASSCADVSSCVYSDPPAIASKASAPACDVRATGAFTACGGTSNAARVDCEKGGTTAVGESCVGVGRKCALTKNATAGLCLGQEDVRCTKTGCNGTQLDFCVDAGGGDSFDRGLDCADYGAGSCIDVQASGDDAGLEYVGPTCAPVDAGSCDSRQGVRCLGATAVSCPNGSELRVNCGALANGVTCIPSSDAPAWDVTSACATESATCTADSCSSDNRSLIACVRGSPVNIDCASMGLGACAIVTTSDGLRASCAAP